MARSMVTEYGMSSKLGAVKYGTGDAEPFMGRDYGHQRDYSEDIAADIDAEVRGLIEGAHDEAWEILVQYRDVLDAMVLELVEKETLTKEDLERILAPVRKRPPHNTFSGFGKRTPSDRPPIEIPLSAQSNGRHGANEGPGAAGPAAHSELRAAGLWPAWTDLRSTVRTASPRRTRASRATASRGRATGTQARATASAGARNRSARPGLRRSPGPGYGQPPYPPPGGGQPGNRGPQGNPYPPPGTGPEQRPGPDGGTQGSA